MLRGLKKSCLSEMNSLQLSNSSLVPSETFINSPDSTAASSLCPCSLSATLIPLIAACNPYWQGELMFSVNALSILNS